MNISLEVLSQLSAQIAQLQPEQYAQKLEVFNGSSIGGHTRHVIEFFECLLNALETRQVNYDVRQRDIMVEQNRDYALSIIERCKQKIGSIEDKTMRFTLAAEFGANHTFSIPTSFEREEIYLIEHSIHHFALIKIGIQAHFPEVDIVPGFGIAYSTIAHQAKKDKTVEQIHS
jgi:hypothetical protein